MSNTMTNAKARKEAKRFGVTSAHAAKLELYRSRLNAEADTPAGTEARKRLKQLSTHEYKPQVIQSNDFSKVEYSKRSGNTAHGPVRARGKTDRDSVRYKQAKDYCPINEL